MSESISQRKPLEDENGKKEEQNSPSTPEGQVANVQLQKTLEENKYLQNEMKKMKEQIASLEMILLRQRNDDSGSTEAKEAHVKKIEHTGSILSRFSFQHWFGKSNSQGSDVKFQALSDIELQPVDEAIAFVVNDDDNDIDIKKETKKSTTSSSSEKVELSSLVKSEKQKDSDKFESDLEVLPNTYINQSFFEQFKDRCSWLVGLLILQSCSSFILKRNEELLESHLDIYNFLTMLVGAGGNAGNQACVRVIRELALGSLNHRTQRPFLITEFKMGICLSIVLAISGLGRALFFGVSLEETIAITTALWTIVIISVTIGALLPLCMKHLGIDPAHSSTTIQVVMDILGVTITVVVSSIVLGRFKNL